MTFPFRPETLRIYKLQASSDRKVQLLYPK